jgi:transporter family-2 protein
MLAYASMTLLFGVLVTVHVSMNARVGSLIGSPALANAVFWGVGFAVSAALAVFRGAGAPVAALVRVPPFLFAAGLLGSFLALFNTWIIPKVGIAVFSLLIILGQLLASWLFSVYGVLGTPREAVSAAKLGGLLLSAAGTVLFLLAK